jgi:hypothetical protein
MNTEKIIEEMKNDLRYKHQITLHRKKTFIPSKLAVKSPKVSKAEAKPALKKK